MTPNNCDVYFNSTRPKLFFYPENMWTSADSAKLWILSIEKCIRQAGVNVLNRNENNISILMGLPWFVPKLWIPTRGFLGTVVTQQQIHNLGMVFTCFYNPFILVYHSTLWSDKPQSQSSWISRDPPQSWTSIPIKLSVPLPGEYACPHPWRYDQSGRMQPPNKRAASRYQLQVYCRVLKTYECLDIFRFQYYVPVDPMDTPL